MVTNQLALEIHADLLDQARVILSRNNTALALYLSATCSIISKCQTLRAQARRDWAAYPEQEAIVIRLADRQQAKELKEARRAYECTLEAVAEEMEEA